MTTSDYAYITLLYPNKEGQCTYLDGALLMALSLKKQKTHFKIICLITHDISEKTTNILKIVFDELIVVDYISPIKNKGICINNEIFDKKNYINDYNYNDICNVFTKLHIFDSTKLPYKKIVFIDLDIITLKYYDKLFELETPAGWVEQIFELITDKNIGYTRVWGQWENIKHGQKIPKFVTDIYKKPGSSINAGLMIITPDVELFNQFILELKKSKNEWFGRNFMHKGSIDIYGNFVNYYPYPEQNYLTQYFSGEWKMIDGLYAAWGNKCDCAIYGIHMAGLKYNINGEWKEYKTWMIQIPLDDGFNDITNKIAIWGLKKYPILKKYIMSNLQIYCDSTLFKFNLIKKNDIIYNKMIKTQQILHNMLFD